MKQHLPDHPSLWKLSLPVRGRGLKPVPSEYRNRLFVSLPVRGRGLKLVTGDSIAPKKKSLPVRGRGLKLRHPHQEQEIEGRSPCGGVD